MDAVAEHEIERRLGRIEYLVELVLYLLKHQSIFATDVMFKEISMNPTEGGYTLIYSGTLAPAGSVFAPDATFTVTSNDPAVSPTVDSTGLIVTIPLPAGWVEDIVTPLAIDYASASASTGQALTAVITPSAPPPALATSISFQQIQ